MRNENGQPPESPLVHLALYKLMKPMKNRHVFSSYFQPVASFTLHNCIIIIIHVSQTLSLSLAIILPRSSRRRRRRNFASTSRGRSTKRLGFLPFNLSRKFPVPWSPPTEPEEESDLRKRERERNKQKSFFADQTLDP